MTNSSVLPKSPQRFSAAVSRGLREGSAISLGALVLVLVVALISFDARDPGFSYTGSGEAIHNRIGSVGAYFADFLYFLRFRRIIAKRSYADEFVACADGEDVFRQIRC